MGLFASLLPVLEDNYIFFIKDASSGQTAVVDPALATPVLGELHRLGWSLDWILNTHHHDDHVGANLEIQAATGCRIAGAAHDAARIPGIQRLLQPEEVFLLGESALRVMDVPGHTRGHIAYYYGGTSPIDGSEDPPRLFCGDVVFGMGCGRLFEGTPAEMWKSLSAIKQLPLNTLIYCAHEYTLMNGRFAETIEPDHQPLRERMESLRALRSRGEFSVPMSLELELATNPFLRSHDLEEFTARRTARNHFRS